MSDPYAGYRRLALDRPHPRVLRVTLSRPEKLNALTRPMWKRLGEAFTELSADEAVRCIVIRGAGTKAFAPGNDISEFETERATRKDDR